MEFQSVLPTCPVHQASQGWQYHLCMHWAPLPEHGEVATYLALLLGGLRSYFEGWKGVHSGLAPSLAWLPLLPLAP